MSTQHIWCTNNEHHPDYGHQTDKSSSTNQNNSALHNPYLIGIQSRFRRRYYHKSIVLMLLLIIIILTVAVIIIACLLHFPNEICHTAECLRSAAALKHSMDLSVNPCDDFYQYACGNWEDEHPRPDAYVSFDWFSERQTKILRNIRQYLQANDSVLDPKPVTNARVMYRACMNLTAMDRLGYGPVFKYLKQFHLPPYPSILNVTNTTNESNLDGYGFDWIRSLAKIKQMLGMDVFIGFDVYPDPQHRDYNRLVLGTPESGSDLPFNNIILKHLLRGRMRPKSKVSGRYDAEGEAIDENEDNSGESKDEERHSLKAYKKFMVGVMKLLVNHTHPDIKVDFFNDSFERAASITIEVSESISKFNQEAENASKSANVEDRLNLQDIVYCTARDLQNITDTHLAANNSFPVWEKLLESVFEGIPEAQLNLQEEIILTSNSDILYLKLLVGYLSITPLAHIELYIWWNVVEELILHTTMEVRRLYYEYYKTISTADGFSSRTLYCTGTVNRLLGMAVSYAISNHNFTHHTKPKVQDMLGYIRTAFEGLVRDTTWMDWSTKRSTLQKTAAMRSLIGFPEWILDQQRLEQHYSGLVVNESTHLENMLEEIQRKNIIKLRRWRQKHELNWETLPTNVNAFHTFQENAITIPIAILQYPFYHLGLEALNYGALGTILGHELTHGFDDSGRQFDQNGNLKQWWTNQTIKEYVNRTMCFVSQYSQYYIPEVDDYIDGLLTLGENIADNGGLREAFRAYQLYKKSSGKEAYLPGFEDFTHEQLFFISFGNIWCESHTQAAAKAYLEDSHCPGKFRLKGVLTNSPEFSQTFGCKSGTAMNPAADKCRIW
ncbi:neprilysin-1 [Anopheles aquasalis]|uniref:neprilysin-1 n=1 Tax=Anopheles aquasalis TaxID=42839 RepID=UPI00215AC43E|nr:neprilysin-1 [Anopheles aquasalis]